MFVFKFLSIALTVIWPYLFIKHKLYIRGPIVKRKRHRRGSSIKSGPVLCSQEETKRAALEEKRIEKAVQEIEKAEKQEKKQEQKRFAAAQELEYIRHRRNQIYNLIEIAEDKQAGTIYGSKDWLKLEKQIMSYENQLYALKKREYKAKADREEE